MSRGATLLHPVRWKALLSTAPDLYLSTTLCRAFPEGSTGQAYMTETDNKPHPAIRAENGVNRDESSLQEYFYFHSRLLSP